MKKILLIAVSALISTSTLAVEFESTASLKDTDCVLLNESVTITLSKDVKAGVGCNAKAIALSACHIGGRTATRDAPVCVDTDGDATTGLGGKEDCGENGQVSGAAMASASTEKGTVTAQYPGSTCTATLAAQQATENLPEE